LKAIAAVPGWGKKKKKQNIEGPERKREVGEEKKTTRTGRPRAIKPKCQHLHKKKKKKTKKTKKKKTKKTTRVEKKRESKKKKKEVTST